MRSVWCGEAARWLGPDEACAVPEPIRAGDLEPGEMEAVADDLRCSVGSPEAKPATVLAAALSGEESTDRVGTAGVTGGASVTAMAGADRFSCPCAGVRVAEARAFAAAFTSAFIPPLAVWGNSLEVCGDSTAALDDGVDGAEPPEGAEWDSR